MSQLPTTTDEVVFPSTIGELLREDFLEPLDMSAADLATKLLVAKERLIAVVNDEAPLDPDLDLRLSRYFGLSNGFLLGYQSRRELRVKQHELRSALDRIVPRMAQAA